MTIYQRAVLAVSVVLAWVSAVPALPWTELGDAGALPGTAQSTQGAGPGSLTSINGSLSDLDQEDMFVIQVTDPLAFSATTVGTGGGGLIEDSQLFLFNTAGLGVYANDDADGLTRRSTLPAGHLSGSLSAGLYFLAISGFDRDPVGAVDLIFPNFPRSEVSGPSGPDGGTPISGWSGFGDFGPYTILLTGADPVPPSVPPVSVPTPEPSTIILLGILIPIVVIQARQRQRQTAQKNPLDG